MRAQNSMADGGVLDKPITATTANRHWDAYRKYVSWVLQNVADVERPVTLLSVFKEEHIVAYIASLEHKKNLKGMTIAAGTARTTYCSFCVLVDLMITFAPYETKKQRRRSYPFFVAPPGSPFFTCRLPFPSACVLFFSQSYFFAFHQRQRADGALLIDAIKRRGKNVAHVLAGAGPDAPVGDVDYDADPLTLDDAKRQRARYIRATKNLAERISNCSEDVSYMRFRLGRRKAAILANDFMMYSLDRMRCNYCVKRVCVSEFRYVTRIGSVRRMVFGRNLKYMVDRTPRTSAKQ